MKSLLLLFLICFSSSASHASEYLKGYIIMQNNDTVTCRFRAKELHKSISFKRIVVINEKDEEQVYKADDKKILGFGFVDWGRQYDFLYVEVKPKSETGFYQRIVNGKYKLYIHEVFMQTSPGLSTAMPTYVMFNPAGEYVSFETCMVCPWKKQLKKLVQSDAKALEALERTSRLEIKAFAEEINRE